MRIVLAEDHALLRDGLTRTLESFDFTVVAAVVDGPSLLPTLMRERPDLAVVDVRLPPTFTDEGLQAALAARAQIPGLPIVVLSQHVEPLYARELLAVRGGGGVGYQLKERVSNVGQFVEALRQVAAGGTMIDPEVVECLIELSGPIDALSSREREVLSEMAAGRSNAGIAAKLFITEKAVSKHINNIFAKLDLPASDDDHRRVLAVLAYLNL